MITERLPRLRRHKHLKYAYLVYRVNGKRRYVYLGPWGSPKARVAYDAFVRAWPDQITNPQPPAQRWPARRLLTFAGKTQSIDRWAAEVGVKATTIRFRLDVLAWDVERALTTPTRPKGGTAA